MSTHSVLVVVNGKTMEDVVVLNVVSSKSVENSFLVGTIDVVVAGERDAKVVWRS